MLQPLLTYILVFQKNFFMHRAKPRDMIKNMLLLGDKFFQ